jgi:hypothetical protein
MSKIPFERFIITFLILGKDVAFIVSKLKEFHYHIDPNEVSELFENLKQTISPNLKLKLDTQTPWSLSDEQDQQWLKQLGIFEYYDYLIRRTANITGDPPPYFKWFRESLWIHAHEDVMSIINIFIFNKEPLESISDIISFRYKKKIGIEALECHKKIYWDCDIISAKEALYHCIPFRKNALIVRNIKFANITTIVKLNEEEDDGSDTSFVFHDSNYIKWKIGYKKLTVPGTKDFLEQVKQDSYFKYYESMMMSQSVEVEEEAGNNDFGPFDKRVVKRRNVEEQKARAAKHWLELYLKANESMPEGEKKGEINFFEKMSQLSLQFDDEKIMTIDELPDVLKDISGDR